MFCEVFHSILFLSLIFLDDPSHKHKKEKKNLEIMSPETTRVSLESTVDILIRRPEQQNCIQCKSKKKRIKKGSIFQKMIKRKKRTSRGFNDDQISDIKPMLLFSRNNSCRCCSCRYNSCGRGQRSAQASERSEYSPTSIS
jgi:hypothetical protein